MTPGSRRTLPASFLDRLVDQLDPRRPVPDPRLPSAQRACGRWLALRRIELKLTSEQVAEMIGLTSDALRLLEAGLAEPALMSDAAQQLLARALVRARLDLAWVADVVALACGRAAALRVEVLDRVIADLELIESAPPDLIDALRAVEPEPVAAAPAAPAGAKLLLEEPLIFEILSVLAEAEQHTYAIWDAVSRRFGRVGVAKIGVLVMLMRDNQWIAESPARLDPDLDSEPLQHYRMTSAGRRMLEAGLARRESQADDSAPQGAPHNPSTLPEAG